MILYSVVVPTIPRELQVRLALRRLARALVLERKYGPTMSARGLRLIRETIHLAYCDCRALGVAEAGRAILRTAAEVAA